MGFWMRLAKGPNPEPKTIATSGVRGSMLSKYSAVSEICLNRESSFMKYPPHYSSRNKAAPNKPASLPKVAGRIRVGVNHL